MGLPPGSVGGAVAHRTRELLSAARHQSAVENMKAARELKDLAKEEFKRRARRVRTHVFHGNRIVGRIHEAVVEGRLLRDASFAAAKRSVDTVRTTAGLSSAEGAVVAAEDRAVASVLGGQTALDRVARSMLIGVLGTACKVLMTTLNTTRVEGQHHLTQALLHREEGQPLITVSNHVASIDDPLVVSAILPMETLMDAEAVRWTMCASDRCFKNELMSSLMRLGKVLPVDRGAGAHQVGVNAAVSQAAQGGWVHIFPEGTRSKDGRLQAVRRGGVGRLVASPSSKPPLVVPFYHAGMGKVVPRGALVPLSVGNEVHVVVGEPIPVEDLVLARRAGRISENDMHAAVGERVGAALEALQGRADAMVAARAEERAMEAEAGAGAWAAAGEGEARERPPADALAAAARASVAEGLLSAGARLAPAGFAASAVKGGSGGGGKQPIRWWEWLESSPAATPSSYSADRESELAAIMAAS